MTTKSGILCNILQDTCPVGLVISGAMLPVFYKTSDQLLQDGLI